MSGSIIKFDPFRLTSRNIRYTMKIRFFERDKRDKEAVSFIMGVSRAAARSPFVFESMFCFVVVVVVFYCFTSIVYS